MSQLLLSSDSLLASPTAGTIEYNGTAMYGTPTGTQRGVIPGIQYYSLNSALTGSNATGAQSVFGVGVTLSSSTVYAFEAMYALSKTVGTTSHTVSYGFGGSATLNSIAYTRCFSYSTTSFAAWTSALTNFSPFSFIQTATATSLTNETTSTAGIWWITHLKGIVSVNAGGNFIPQYQLSAAPGGAYTVAAGSYFSIYPVAASGANTSVGTWA